MKKVFIPALLLLVAAVSCKKDDAPVSTEPTKYLSKIDYGGNTVTQFTYSGGTLATLSFSTTYKTIKDSAFYTNGMLTGTYDIDPTAAQAALYYQFEYDANKRPVKTHYLYGSATATIATAPLDSLVYDNAGKLAYIYKINILEDGSHFIYEMNEITMGNNGNVATVVTKSTTDLSNPEFTFIYKNVYTYDTKVSMHSRTASPIYWITTPYANGLASYGPNNLTKTESYSYDNGNFTLSGVKAFVYTYDADGDILTAQRLSGSTETDLSSIETASYYYITQ